MSKSGNMPVTSGGESQSRDSRKENGQAQIPQRPMLFSNHSNSVPSTPHQHPREFRTRSRSPSPNGVQGSHSPRSVSSETNGRMASLRQASICPFETSAAFGRRRIPYNIGADLLEKVKDVKASLTQKEEEKLTGDMRELYDRLLPSTESEQRRKKLVEKVETILRTEWPGDDFKVHVFGSSGNLLCTSESDVDMCIQTSIKKLETMHILAEVLHKNGMERVICVASAKVPIVKIWDPELKLACDMNVNNMLALQNTRLIKTYVQIDERVRPLAMIVKHWTKQRILNDAALGGTLSSYTWICMILNFLQTRDPPIIPSLHHHEARKPSSDNPKPLQFADDLNQLRGYGKQNQESLGQLLFSFFRYHGHELDYEISVISVREGRVLSRQEKAWDVASRSKEGHNRLCVEEPFNTDRNLGNSADETAFRGIHLEIRRAFDLLADGGQLQQACEEFIYPQEERKPVFKKPAPAPKPILSYANAPRGRGGGSIRGGRGPANLKQNQNYGRRASGSANYNNMRPPYIHSPGVAGHNQGYFPAAQPDYQTLLYQHYQLLEAQKAQLQQSAREHAHAVATHGRTFNGHASPQKSGFAQQYQSSPRSSDVVPVMPMFWQRLYTYPAWGQGQDMGQQLAGPDSSPRTNPSSPSLAQSTPALRRAIHRTSAASEMPSAALRSHSQPPRGLMPQFVQHQPMPQLASEYMAHNTYFANHGYPAIVTSQPSSAETVQQPFPPIAQHLAAPQYVEQGFPKEYLGYYMEHPPKPDFSVPDIPKWEEIEARRKLRQTAPELVTESLLDNTARRTSRSRSPLGIHLPDCSTSQALQSAPIDGAFASTGRNASIRPTYVDTAGPLVVNGSCDPNHGAQLAEPFAPEEGSESANTESSGGFIPTPAESHDSDVHFNLELPQSRQAQLDVSEMLHQHALAEAKQANTTSPPNDLLSQGRLSQRPNGLTIVSSSPGYNTISTHGTPHSMAKTQEELLYPKSSTQPEMRQPAPPNGISSVDTLLAKPDVVAEMKSGLGPHLSPVFETRTPSPIPRHSESKQLHSKPINGENGHVKQSATNDVQPKSPLATKPTTHALDASISKSSSSASSQAQMPAPQPVPQANAQSTTNGQPNAWQKSSGKKNKRKNKSGANKPNGEASKAQGEAAPASVAERKGG